MTEPRLATLFTALSAHRLQLINDASELEIAAIAIASIRDTPGGLNAIKVQLGDSGVASLQRALDKIEAVARSLVHASDTVCRLADDAMGDTDLMNLTDLVEEP